MRRWLSPHWKILTHCLLASDYYRVWRTNRNAAVFLGMTVGQLNTNGTYSIKLWGESSSRRSRLLVFAIWIHSQPMPLRSAQIYNLCGISHRRISEPLLRSWPHSSQTKAVTRFFRKARNVSLVLIFNAPWTLAGPLIIKMFSNC